MTTEFIHPPWKVIAVTGTLGSYCVHDYNLNDDNTTYIHDRASPRGDVEPFRPDYVHCFEYHFLEKDYNRLLTMIKAMYAESYLTTEQLIEKSTSALRCLKIDPTVEIYPNDAEWLDTVDLARLLQINCPPGYHEMSYDERNIALRMELIRTVLAVLPSKKLSFMPVCSSIISYLSTSPTPEKCVTYIADWHRKVRFTRTVKCHILGFIDQRLRGSLDQDSMFAVFIESLIPSWTFRTYYVINAQKTDLVHKIQHAKTRQSCLCYLFDIIDIEIGSRRKICKKYGKGYVEPIVHYKDVCWILDTLRGLVTNIPTDSNFLKFIDQENELLTHKMSDILDLWDLILHYKEEILISADFKDLEDRMCEVTLERLAEPIKVIPLETASSFITTYKQERKSFYDNCLTKFASVPLETFLLPSSCCVERKVRYALCMDLEATFEDVPFNDSSHEVIEIAVVIIDLLSGEICGEFQTYVKPTLKENQVLSDICLDMLKQGPAVLDRAPSFPAAMHELSKWLATQDFLSPPTNLIPYGRCYPLAEATQKPVSVPPWCLQRNFVWVTHGLADFERFLCRKSCKINSVQLPPFMIGDYVDLMQTYAVYMGYRVGTRRSLPTMCETLGLAFLGDQHNALCDARAVANIYHTILKKQTTEGSPLVECNAYIDMDSPEYCAMFQTNTWYNNKKVRCQHYRFTPIDKYSQGYESIVHRLIRTHAKHKSNKSKTKKKNGRKN